MSDDDYRSLALGYLSRARPLLAGLEQRRRRLGFHMSALAVLPPVVLKPIADALPKLDEAQKRWLYLGSVLVIIAAGIFSFASQLADSRQRVEAKKSAARSLIADLGAIPPNGALNAWQRQLIDEASGAIKSLREFMEK